MTCCRWEKLGPPAALVFSADGRPPGSGGIRLISSHPSHRIVLDARGIREQHLVLCYTGVSRHLRGLVGPLCALINLDTLRYGFFRRLIILRKFDTRCERNSLFTHRSSLTSSGAGERLSAYHWPRRCAEQNQRH